MTILIGSHSKDIKSLLSVCKTIGVTHWITCCSGNEIRNHYRKNGPTNISILDDKIGLELGINLGQELRVIDCKNIVIFINKSDPNTISKILKKGNRCFIFKEKHQSLSLDWKLSKSEVLILQALSEGLEIQLIAIKLKESVTGVKKELNLIRQKTGIYDRAEIVAAALRTGVIG